MSRLAKLQLAETIFDVSELLGFRASALTYILYSKSAPAKYQTFQIAKKSGGTRTIEAPNPKLKLLQRRLATLLQDCMEEIKTKYDRHDAGLKPDKVSHGFERNRSIVTNAHQHRCRRFVFNLDLADFFPSINFGRVRGFFISDKNFALRPPVATVLAQIACFGNHLPQGSPCSPVVANLIGHILDVHLVQLARQNGCQYTRYADDLTFSTNKRVFPRGVAVPVENDAHEWAVGKELSRLIALSGFRVNERKVRMQYRPSRQEVTGLVVNQKVNVPATYRRTVRAMVHRLLRTGSFELEATIATESGTTLTKAAGTLAQLHGRLAFIDSIDVYNQKQTPRRNGPTMLSAKEKTYRQFLLYKDFYAATTPVLVCEGKTDLIYLTHAMRSLAPMFPRLASVDGLGKVALSVRRYRYADRSTGRILGIRGGHGDLQKLLNAYREALNAFVAAGPNSAVIVIVDQDAAAKPVLATIRQLTGMPADPKAPFIHVLKNLYVVFTPLPPGATESIIEDFFDSETRAIRIRGKAFDPSNAYSTASHYGKADFAHKVVAANAGTIDFSGFRELLGNISSALEDYARRKAP